MDTRSHRRRQYLGTASGLGFGLVTAALSVRHAFSDEPLVGILLGVAPPLLISFGIVLASVRLHRSRFEDGAPWHLARWLGAGTVVGLLVGLLVVNYQQPHDGVVVHANYVVLDSMVGGGGVGMVVGYFDFRRAEEARKLATTSVILDTVREVNRQIATTDDRTELEREICETLASADPYVFAWVGERDGERVVPRATGGIDSGYLEDAEITVDGGPRSLGPTGTAVRTRETQVLSDLHEDPSFEPWRDAAKRRGFRSSMAIPLVSEDAFYGVLSIYAHRTDAFTGQERAVLSEVGDTLAEAIAANELRESRERLLDSMDDAVFVSSLETGTILGVNQTAVDRLGYTEAEFRSMTPQDVTASAAEEDVGSRLAQIETEGRLVFDSVHETKDGETFPVEVSATTITYSGDAAVLAIVRDVSDRKEKERTLQTYREAIEQAGHAIYITDTDGVIEYVNPAFEDQTGYASDEVVGETPAVLQSGQYDDAFYDDLWETILDGEVWHYEGMVDTRRDGSNYYVDQTISPIVVDGEVVRFVAVNRDITELKEYQKRLESRTEQLELLNQLVRHDIRNDMQVVIGMGELLEDHVDEEGGPYLDTVVDHSEHVVELTRTVGELMTVLLMDDDADLGPVSLPPVVENEVSALATANPDASVRIEGDVPSTTVRANEMLDSVFRNVLNNSVQHNRGDDPEVVVSVTEDEETVTVHVADDGPGVPEGRRDEIFGKGERGLESSGSGLGLYLVSTLLDYYGGEVSVRDNEPTGAVFDVTLQKTD